jgi:hypothetical protein
MKRYIGNGTEIKKFYQFLVANELVHSDYCFEYPFEQKTNIYVDDCYNA